MNGFIRRDASAAVNRYECGKELLRLYNTRPTIDLFQTDRTDNLFISDFIDSNDTVFCMEIPGGKNNG